MRVAFIRTLSELAAVDRRIVLLTGDLGFSVIEPFAERYPDRFFNVGVAEQNMIGLATGLAEGGFIPFVYSIATFATLRPYEFIRNGPVLHHLPVRIVGVGGGFEYGDAGPTHHALEDLAALRALPGLRIICPADHRQTEAALRATWKLRGPTYFRLGKDDQSTVDGLEGRFRLRRGELVREGEDILLVTLGSVAKHAVRAADLLETSGVRAGVLVVSTVSPSPEADLADNLGRFKVALTVEAHQVVGGLGSLASEVVATHGISCRILRLGVRNLGRERGGSEAFLLARSGLSADRIADAAMKALSQLALSSR